MEKRIISCPCPFPNPGFSCLQPRHYTDYAIKASTLHFIRKWSLCLSFYIFSCLHACSVSKPLKRRFLRNPYVVLPLPQQFEPKITLSEITSHFLLWWSWCTSFICMKKKKRIACVCAVEYVRFSFKPIQSRFELLLLWLKKVCKMQRDRNFVLITFLKLSETFLRQYRRKLKWDLWINLCPLHEKKMGTTKREYLLEGYLWRTRTYKAASKRWC